MSVNQSMNFDMAFDWMQNQLLCTPCTDDMITRFLFQYICTDVSTSKLKRNISRPDKFRWSGSSEQEFKRLKSTETGLVTTKLVQTGPFKWSNPNCDE